MTDPSYLNSGSSAEPEVKAPDSRLLSSDLCPPVYYAGCLDSDPYLCLKQCDKVIVGEFGRRGIAVRELQEELPQRRFFRKLNRSILYPVLIRRVLRQYSQQPATNTQQPPTLHISSQCYANLIPLAGCPVSITVHDVAEHYFPQDLSAAQMRRWKRRIALLKQADLIFSVSQHTKNDLIQIFGISDDKIIVNPNGVDSAFQRMNPDEAEAHCPDVAMAKKDHFLILVTSADLYRKNLDTLLTAVSVLRSRGVPVKLVKTGDSFITHHTSRITHLGLSDYIIECGYISQKKLVALHSLCDVLAVPSLYEGFGMPVVEAQRCGLPCVISNAASLPEVGGDGALYHDPLDVEQLSDLLQRIYEEQNLRNDLREKGLKNAERFSWEKHIDILMEGLGKIFAEHSSS